jgi:hypothetical protein
VTYAVEMFDAIDLDDFYLLRWDFDFDADGTPAEACVLVSRDTTTDILNAALLGGCGQESWSTATARIVDGATIEFTMNLLDLVEGGHMRRGRPYGYRVTATDQHRVKDTAPPEGLIEHTDVPVPTPRPGIENTLIGARTDGRTTGDRDADGTEGGGAPGDPSAAPGEGEGATPGQGRLVLSVPIIGNLCSGSLCFAMGAGAPLAGALMAWVIFASLRSRKRRGAPSTPSLPRVVDHGADTRSHPGHL